MLAYLEARRFRNLAPTLIDLSPGTHLVLGTNGAGKTSFLEAVYLLATTRSFRTTQLADCGHHDAVGFTLLGEVDGVSRIRLEYSWSKTERSRLVNGNRTSLAEHVSALPCVSWTSRDAEVLTGPPGDRRRFLDRGVVGRRPASLATISRYRHALREKRQLLQRGTSNLELETWNHLLADAAADLAAQRAAYVEALSTTLAEILTGTDLDLASIELRYQPSPARSIEGADALREEFATVAHRERDQRRPLLGPHRDDLRILFGGHEIRRVASAGERKAVGLALLAAHGRVLNAAGHPPIYLLDDADIELDQKRLTALWALFADAGQVFATSNRPWVWNDVEIHHRWDCIQGEIRPEGAT